MAKRNRYRLQVNDKGKVVKTYTDKNTTPKMFYSSYMIVHTGEQLTYDRLDEHIQQCGIKTNTFWEMLTSGTAIQIDNMLESLHLQEIETF